MTTRHSVRFRHGGIDYAAWHYPGDNQACMVMGCGTAITKEPGTDQFAERFQQAGFTVLAFDYRNFGESGGEPRQVLRVKEQLADYAAALAFAATLPGVDACRIVLWGFSLAGGHVLAVAARHPTAVAAVIAQSPLVDGQTVVRNAARHQTPRALLQLTATGILDTARGLLGRSPLLVPLTGAPGEVAVLTTPDSADADRALNPGGRYPYWQQQVAARSALRLGFYRPGRFAARVSCPVLFLVCDEDQSVLAQPSLDAARRATQADVVHLPGSHYAPFLQAHEQAVQAELAFLRRHLAAAAEDPAEQRPDASTPPRLLYDGNCRFCTSTAETAARLLNRDGRRNVQVVASQCAGLPPEGGIAARAQREVLWIGSDGTIAGGADAVASWLRHRGFPYLAIGTIMTWPGPRQLARAAYRVIAANRHRLPARSPLVRNDSTVSPGSG